MLGSGSEELAQLYAPILDVHVTYGRCIKPSIHVTGKAAMWVVCLMMRLSCYRITTISTCVENIVGGMAILRWPCNQLGFGK